MQNKILALLQTGDSTNIKLALELMESTGVIPDFEPFKELETWLKYSKEVFFVQDSIVKRIAYLFQSDSIYVLDQYLGHIPEEIGLLKHLKKLELPVNKITELPSSIGELENLEKLRLSNNRLSTVPETIQNCRKLELLDLSANPINPKEQARIIEYLPHCKVLFK